MSITVLIGMLFGFWLIGQDHPNGMTFNMIAVYMAVYWVIITVFGQFKQLMR